MATIQGQGYEKKKNWHRLFLLTQTAVAGRDLTPSNKHGTNFDDDDHVSPSHPPPTLFSEEHGNSKNIFFTVEHFKSHQALWHNAAITNSTSSYSSLHATSSKGRPDQAFNHNSDRELIVKTTFTMEFPPSFLRMISQSRR